MSKIILTDELLKEAAAKAMKIECAVYEKYTAQEEEHEFSKEHERRIRELVRENCGKGKEKSGKYRGNRVSLRIRIAFVAVVVLMMGSMTVLAVEPLRTKLYQMIERIFPDHTDITFEEVKEEVNSQVREFAPEDYPRELRKVPEGYKLTNEEKQPELFFLMQIYMNDKEQAIVYQQVPIDYSDGWDISSNGTDAQEVSVCGEKAYLIIDDKKYRTIIFTKDGFAYMLGGDEDVEVLIDCLESVFEDD